MEMVAVSASQECQNHKPGILWRWWLSELHKSVKITSQASCGDGGCQCYIRVSKSQARHLVEMVAVSALQGCQNHKPGILWRWWLSVLHKGVKITSQASCGDGGCQCFTRVSKSQARHLVEMVAVSASQDCQNHEPGI